MDYRSRARGRRLGVTLRVERFPRQMAAVKMNPGCGAGWILVPVAIGLADHPKVTR